VSVPISTETFLVCWRLVSKVGVDGLVGDYVGVVTKNLCDIFLFVSARIFLA
jgi:hypothetical protein